MRKQGWGRLCLLVLICFSLTALLIPSRAEASELRLTNPSGGETFLRGQSHLITWVGGYSDSEITVSLSTDSGATFEEIGSGSRGNFTWMVPTDISATSKARIKIEGIVDYERERIWHSPATWTWGTKVPVYGEDVSEGDFKITSVPKAPTNLEAAALSTSEIELTWTNNADNEDGFRVKRDGTVIANVDANVQNFTDTELSPATRYSYKVKAFNDVGVSDYSNEASASTNIPPVIIKPDPIEEPTVIEPSLRVPEAPSNLAVNIASQMEDLTVTSIQLAWVNNSTSEEGFKVERQLEGEPWALIGEVGEGETSYLDQNNFTPDTTYNYRVYAHNEAGESTYSNIASLTTPSLLLEPESPPLTVPKAPTNLEATALSTSEIELTWTDNADNEDGFRVKRDGAVIAGVGADVQSFTDSGLATSTSYTYKVKAFNDEGVSAYTNEASATTQAEEMPPEEPVEVPPDEEMLPEEPPDEEMPPEEPAEVHPDETEEPTTILFYIHSNDYYVDGILKEMDTAPVIRESRTMLPIRYVAEPLGASVTWEADERKATVSLDNTVVEVWIDNNQGRVNGVDQYIDENNHNVMPFIAPPGRTMLPLRFIAESLGCQVEWDAEAYEVKITY